MRTQPPDAGHGASASFGALYPDAGHGRRVKQGIELLRCQQASAEGKLADGALRPERFPGERASRVVPDPRAQCRHNAHGALHLLTADFFVRPEACLLYTSPSPRD